MREYMMFVGKDSKDYFDAVLKDLYAPSEENSKRLEDISNKITANLIKTQIEKESLFKELYGSEMLEFIRGVKLGDNYFLVGKDKPFYLSWSIKSDENDNYWCINFRRGEFDYVLDICGGYGGTEVLEKNISKERVVELLNRIDDDERSVATEAS